MPCESCSDQIGSCLRGPPRPWKVGLKQFLPCAWNLAEVGLTRQPPIVPGESVKIEIDDEVFEFLQSKAKPLVDTANDVLRRLLLGDLADEEFLADTSVALPRPSTEPLRKRVIIRRYPGALSRLIEEGLLHAGDQLTHERKRTGQMSHAIVTSEGWVRLPDNQVFSAPSPALKACVGTEIDGWASWRHVRSNRRYGNYAPSYQVDCDLKPWLRSSIPGR